MQNTLLIQVLSTFSKTEWKHWEAFVSADYHLKNKKTKLLGQQIALLGTNWKNKEKTKQALWQLAFGRKAYHEANFNNHLSDLLALTYSFIAIEELRQQDAVNNDLLLQGLFKKGLHQSAQRTTSKWESKHSKSPERGPAELLALNRIATFKDDLHLLESKRTYAETLQQKSDYLDQYYLLQQLMYYCEMLNRGKIIQGSYQLNYLDELLRRYEQLDEKTKHELPAIGIYVQLAHLLRSGELENLKNIESLLADYPKALPKKEQRTVFDFLFNFCIQQINSGKPVYYQKVFDLYLGLIQQDLLIRESRISQWTYANIITTGSRLGEWEWTRTFLEDYRQYLPKEDEYNAYHYNLAALRYEQKQYTPALQLLHEVDFKDAFYYQAAKTIQLKIYYLLNELEAFEALVAAAKQFINRNRQLSSSKKLSYLNFLRLIRVLFKLKHNRKYWKTDKWAQQQNKLAVKLADKSYAANHKDWLGEQLEVIS